MRSTRKAGRSDGGAQPARLGSQTLLRGLDVIDVVAEGPIKLGDLAVRLELTLSLIHI
jgi:hypothetical protein